MKIDQEYLKGLLGAFEAAEKPTTDIQELERLGFSYKENSFIFHLQILHDQGFVESESGSGLGYKRGADGYISWSVIPLRLTSQGYEFLEALKNSRIWNEIKTEFKDASIGTLWHVAKQLLECYTKKKVTELIGIDFK